MYKGVVSVSLWYTLMSKCNGRDTQTYIFRTTVTRGHQILDKEKIISLTITPTTDSQR